MGFRNQIEVLQKFFDSLWALHVDETFGVTQVHFHESDHKPLMGKFAMEAAKGRRRI